MANYLLQVAYTPEAWANLIAQPHDRIEAVRPAVEKLGGKITHGWFAFGDYDLIAIVEMPGNVEAAAFSLAAAAGGAVRAIKTTPLLTAAEGVEALKKAGKSGYKAPQAAHA
ncbi:MAG TPA: GYD domain-containing protein [Bryobacteraceae bacterium]|nr:GYD domain-containing protein [Bryobacteraceae bacterium]